MIRASSRWRAAFCGSAWRFEKEASRPGRVDRVDTVDTVDAVGASGRRKPAFGGAALAMCLAILTLAGAAGAASVSVPASTTIADTGGTANVAVSASATVGENVLGGQLSIVYDLTKVAATTVSFSALPASCIGDSSIGECNGGGNDGLRCSVAGDCPGGSCATTSDLTIVFACSSAISGSATIASVTFSGVARGTSTLDIASCTFNEGTPACTSSDGSITVGSCLLDADANGALNVATDVVYISRRLLGLPPVPASFRTQDPTIPSDAAISANVDAVAAQLDVDGSGSTSVSTDLVYISRRELGLTPVPASFRSLDPNIPSDAVISAAVDALCL